MIILSVENVPAELCRHPEKTGVVFVFKDKCLFLRAVNVAHGARHSIHLNSKSMKAISEIKNLTRARNAEHYGLQEAFLRAITAEFSTNYGLAALREAYGKAFENEDSLYLQARGFADTKAIEAKDAERDKLFRFVALSIQSKELSFDDAEAAAAEKLAYVMKPYQGAAAKPYAENTALVSDLVKKLESEDYSTYVETLGLTAAVAALKTANTEFTTIYSRRADEKLVKALADDLKAARGLVDAAFLDLANGINAVFAVAVLIEKDATKEAEVGAVIDAVNAEILQFSETLSRRGVGKKATISTDDTPAVDDAPVVDEGDSTVSEDDVPEVM